MKKLILLCMLICGAASAKDVSPINYRDSIGVADTATGAGTTTFDTSFSEWVRIEGARSIHVFVKLVALPTVIDTNFTSDTFFVNVQFSMNNGILSKTVRLDTLLTTDSAYTGADLLVPDSIPGEYMRAMLIHNTLRRPPAALNKVYGKMLQFYYALVK